jgi:hypothetical protein
MDNGKTQTIEKIEEVFKDLGGFSWEQAETWASFCYAVGMDPLPQLQVMMNNICKVVNTSHKNIPDKAKTPELWIEQNGPRVRFKFVGPF